MSTETKDTTRRGFRIISADETLKFKPSPELVTEFTYRRAPDHLKMEWAKACITDSRSGEIDQTALLWKALEYGLLGWSGVFDGEEREIPFSLERARFLDTWLLIEIRDRVNAARFFEASSVPLAELKSM